MLLGEICTITGGKNPKKMKDNSTDPDHIVKGLKKECMQHGKLIPSRFDNNVQYPPKEINEEDFLHKGDIIISLKTPYCASACDEEPLDRVFISKNYAVIRNISEDYNYQFIAYYFNYRCASDLIKKNGSGVDLNLKQIKEDVKLPVISLDKQLQFLKICDPINYRAVLYETLRDNDEKIIEYALNRIESE